MATNNINFIQNREWFDMAQDYYKYYSYDH